MLDAKPDEEAESDDNATLRAERDALAKEREKLALDLKECRSKTAKKPEAAAFSGEASKPEGLTAPRGGKADDLKEINGVGPAMEKLLHGLGYFHFDQIAAWTPSELAWVDDNLVGFKGRATCDNWSAQAKDLARG